MSNIVPYAEVERMAYRLEQGSERLPWTGCQIWMQSICGSGYGKLRIGHSKDYMVHRLSYSVFVGEIPKGKCVLHKCDVRTCINPDHLFVGTHKENTADMIAKGKHYSHARNKTKCPQGHEYSGLNSQGRRICRTCQNAATLRHYYRTKK